MVWIPVTVNGTSQIQSLRLQLRTTPRPLQALLQIHSAARRRMFKPERSLSWRQSPARILSTWVTSDNFKEVMGYTVLEWLLPIFPSPCTNHKSSEGMYKTGPALERLRKDAGILDEHAKRRHSSHRNRRRRRSTAGREHARDRDGE